MNRDIKDKLDEILSLYDKDEYRCGGYSMTQYSHITAPEDYIESRTDWDTLQSRADDMYYMLSDIKTIIEASIYHDIGRLSDHNDRNHEKLCLHFVLQTEQEKCQCAL